MRFEATLLPNTHPLHTERLGGGGFEHVVLRTRDQFAIAYCQGGKQAEAIAEVLNNATLDEVLLEGHGE